MTAPGPAAPPPYPVPPGPDAVRAVPTPPTGPGVAPPFAAPPVEGRAVRLWIGLGAGALAVLLCCGGGTAATIGLLVAGSQAIDEQARAVTADYYQALVDDQYGEAYDLLCERIQQRESRSEFTRRVSAEPDIGSYQVGEVDADTLTVPVNVVYDDGDRDTQQVTLDQNGSTGQLEVCGVS